MVLINKRHVNIPAISLAYAFLRGILNKLNFCRLKRKKVMAVNEKETRKENIQQQPDRGKEDSRPATPKPPQKKDPNAKPVSDEEKEKK